MTSSIQPPQSERDVRIAKAQALRSMGINPYAQKFDKKHTIWQLLECGVTSPVHDHYVLIHLIKWSCLTDMSLNVVPYATAIITNKVGQIYLFWNKKHGGRQAPSGKIEGTEDPFETITRELREEIWCEIVSSRLLGQKTSLLSPGQLWTGTFFEVTVDREPVIQPEEMHKLEHGQWVTIIPYANALWYAIQTNKGLVTDTHDILTQFHDNIYAYQTLFTHPRYDASVFGQQSIVLPDDLVIDATETYAIYMDLQQHQYCFTPYKAYQKLQFRDINDIIAGPRANISTAGRLMLYRTHGKLSFGKLMDESGEIQVMWHKDACGLVQQHVWPQSILSSDLSLSDLIPSPSPTGEGSKSYDQQNNDQWMMYRQLDPKILAFAKELRQRQTPAEEMMRELLRDRKFLGLEFRRQHPLREFIMLDFYCHEAKLAIELDGSVHNTPAQQQSDKLRDEECAKQGITVLRIRNNDLLNNTEETLNRIKGVIDNLLPSHVGEGLGVRSNQYYTIIRGTSDHRQQFKKLRLEMVSNEPIAFGWTVEHLEQQTEQERKEWISRKIFLFAIDTNGNFVGTINLTPYDDETENGQRDETTAQMNGVYVTPNWRWKGIAQALMNQWLAILSKEHPRIQRVVLWVATTQERAIAMYEKFGWTKTKLMKNKLERYGKVYDEWEMEYMLPSHVGEGVGGEVKINRSSTPLFDQFEIKEWMPTVYRNIGIAIVYNPKNDTCLCHKRIADGAQTLIGGGIEDGEDPIIATMREVHEETGYKNLRFVTELSPTRSHYRHETKSANYYTYNRTFVFELINDEQDPVDPKEMSKHIPQRVPISQMQTFLMNKGGISSTDHVFVWDEWMKWKENNYIKTPRLIISPIQRSDVDNIFMYFTKEVAEHMRVQPSSDKQKTIDFVHDAIQGNHKKTCFKCCARDQQWDFVWCISLMEINTPTPEIGLWIRQDKQWQWYGKEMVQAIIARAEKTLSYNHIIYPIYSDNIASKKIIESLGWKLVVSWRKGTKEDGQEVIEEEYHLYHPTNHTSHISLPDWLTPYKLLEKYIDVGDFLGVRGELFYTHKGELTLFVSEWMLLSKAIRPLGDKFHGIGDDKEKAYRQRYLDMIFNRDTLERMKLRSKFLATIRQFYDQNGFIEIETPVLGHSASGAAAAPFITHHNDFDLDMYLRISPETNLKKATVGMLEKVFEVAKDFRNEWSDPSHHQEFTMIEHYAAYRNYEDNMRFTEQMFDYIFAQIPQLSKVVPVADKNGVVHQVNFQTPRQRIDYVSQIKQDSWIDVSQYSSTDEEKLRNDILSAGHTRAGIETQGVATMIDYLYKKVTRPKIIGPAFVVNYPATMQPLARKSDANPWIVEQRQLVVNGRELIKAYSELVDPIQQQANFDAQSDAIAKGDDEATKGDDDFVLAMEYGMPCQSGRGMGVDRILAMLTSNGQPLNIRDVILFPLVKPEHNDAWKTTNDEKEGKKSDQT